MLLLFGASARLLHCHGAFVGFPWWRFISSEKCAWRGSELDQFFYHSQKEPDEKESEDPWAGIPHSIDLETGE